MVRAAERTQQRSRKQTPHFGLLPCTERGSAQAAPHDGARLHKKFDIDQLVEDVMQAFEDYPADELEKMWQHKSYVMGAVLETKPKKGGSNYPRHATPQSAAFRGTLEDW